MRVERGRTATALLLAALMGGTGIVGAETLLTVDATRPAPALETGYLKMGQGVSPKGGTIAINNRYLTLDGKPWLPIMGEFHYSRFPADGWDEQLAKMKAAGIDIVASYIIWNHHEEVAGTFTWDGDRNLRRFAELCAKHGLKLVVRIGPWSHAEVRYGGIPDWVVDAMPTRGNDPQYLRFVDRYYRQIAAQVKGLLWKDGGPVIGVQLENEYNLTGPGQGREHIASLKQLALAAGFDVPLYTVTGWDQTVYPSGQVVPVFGGYPDEPWKASPEILPPKETYAFRFDSRVSGNLGAQTTATRQGDADPDIPHTPFLGAEYGGGVPAMYRRRAVIDPADISAMLPVQIGSGVNLFGYYMFHGGSNPLGRTTLEENTAIHGHNDTPIIGYDFQAPIGQYGDMRPVLRRVRPFHLFAASYGDQLAPMVPQAPTVLPKALDDLATPRWSFRSAGDAGFLFFSSHVRQYRMQPATDVRFAIDLPGGRVSFPQTPVTIPAGSHFVWPVNMDLGGAKLAYATAQPVTRIVVDGVETHIMQAEPGVPVELALTGAANVQAAGAKVEQKDGRSIVTGLEPGMGAVVGFTANGNAKRLLILTEAQAENLTLLHRGGRDVAVISDTDLYQSAGGFDMRSRDGNVFRYATLPAIGSGGKADGLFTAYERSVPARPVLPVTVEKLRDAGKAPPIRIGGPAKAAMQPAPEAYGRSAAWTIKIPGDTLQGVADSWLELDYQGDVGRLFAGTRLIDDHYFNGPAWRIALKRFAAEIKEPLTLTVMPLRADAPIYIQQEWKPVQEAGGQVAVLKGARLVPEYRLSVEIEK
ncbi:beta-galactosidase [Niveispirillum sp. KHB5.9]|uniref:beta-galactosidase n=1 Tax=Niveispirillum sp. KHB5.9 TaxID=3400269 RepID=UPI003A8432C3